MRFRWLAATVAALALAFGLALPASAAVTRPAAAQIDIMCTYGDNFYNFGNPPGYPDEMGDSNGVFYDAVNPPFTDGTQYCQTGVEGNYSEWVLHGTALCLTYDSANAEILHETCAEKASQEWSLTGYAGVNGCSTCEVFGLIISLYDSSLAMADTGGLGKPVYVREESGRNSATTFVLIGPFHD